MQKKKVQTTITFYPETDSDIYDFLYNRIGKDKEFSTLNKAVKHSLRELVVIRKELETLKAKQRIEKNPTSKKQITITLVGEVIDTVIVDKED